MLIDQDIAIGVTQLVLDVQDQQYPNAQDVLKVVLTNIFYQVITDAMQINAQELHFQLSQNKKYAKIANSVVCTVILLNFVLIALLDIHFIKGGATYSAPTI